MDSIGGENFFEKQIITTFVFCKGCAMPAKNNVNSWEEYSL